MREVMLILHFLGLSMSLGTTFAYFFLGRISAKLGPDEKDKYMMNIVSLGTMGNVGLILSFISGGYLMTPYWSALGSSPILITKLVLFLALGALIGIITSKARKARMGDPEKLKNSSVLGKIAIAVGVAIVTCAVIYFK